jgi:hypothetical protein
VVITTTPSPPPWDTPLRAAAPGTSCSPAGAAACSPEGARGSGLGAQGLGSPGGSGFMVLRVLGFGSEL